jgi:hypothetical protein
VFHQGNINPEEIKHKICDIIKIGRDVEMKLGMPMYENGSCPDMSISYFCYALIF